MTTEPQWKTFLKDNKWTTYLAYQLKQDSNNPQETLLKYEALLTQCSYLSRMAYCPADIFCRMTQHLDVTPNAFNNYIRAIEKIYDKLFNYKCSFDSKYIQEHSKFSEYFEPFKTNPNPTTNAESIQSAGGAEFNNTGIKKNPPIGFFVQNKEYMNVYLYVHHNPSSKFNSEKTLFISFKGSSSIKDFINDLSSAIVRDQLLSDLVPKDPIVQMPGDGNNKEEKETLLNKTNKQPIPGRAGYSFIKTLKPSIKELCEKIKLLKSQGFERVIITGHSLGGALASLFGYYLKAYNKNLVDKPIHVITFGACCTFDAIGRTEFNNFLNISPGENGIFTLDRVTIKADPVILLPPDLDHPGYTLIKTEIQAFTKTGRTNEIGEIRKMLGLTSGYDGNDLLLSEKFVDLFTNSQDFKGTGSYDTDLYRSKFRIKFGSNAKEQQLILKKAMPDANPGKIRELFKTIESETTNKRYNNAPQAGGISFKKGLGEATDFYKKKTKEIMPNQINYNCYITMTMSFCHACYMGVSYVMVLRLPNISEGKLRKEPTKDYTLYQKDGRIFSLASGNYKNNSDCTKVESNIRKNNSAPKANSGANSGAESENRNNNKSGKKSSFMNGLKGIFKTQNKTNNKKTRKSIANSERQPMNPTNVNPANNSTTENPEEANQGGVFSKCSIL
jgi:hypothetical protein